MFLPLEATLGEILTVQNVFQKRYRTQGRLLMLQEEEATEGAVRRAAPQYRYLHLATHGYFAASRVQATLRLGPRACRPGGAAGLVRRAIDPFGGRGVVGFHPGLLSGLALAGANRPHELGQDDGILTALEVAALDLAGVELVTLSACETGLGESAGGEALLGLQRAFQVAGARGVVATLW